MAAPKAMTNARTASTNNIKPAGQVVPVQKPLLAKAEAVNESDNIDSKLNRLQDLLKMAKKS